MKKIVMYSALFLFLFLCISNVDAFAKRKRLIRDHHNLVLYQGDDILEWIYFPKMKKDFTHKSRVKGREIARKYLESFEGMRIENETPITVTDMYHTIEDEEDPNGAYESSKIIFIYNIRIPLDVKPGTYEFFFVNNPLEDKRVKPYRQGIKIEVKNKNDKLEDMEALEAEIAKMPRREREMLTRIVDRVPD